MASAMPLFEIILANWKIVFSNSISGSMIKMSAIKTKDKENEATENKQHSLNSSCHYNTATICVPRPTCDQASCNRQQPRILLCRRELDAEDQADKRRERN